MTDRELPDDLRRFILTSIPSVPYLEAVLLLRGTPPQWWDARETAQRLHISRHVAESILDEMHTTGIAEADGTDPMRYRYAPRSAELQQMLDRLAQAYSRQLIDVTNLIHSATDKMAQHFVDAFRWWKK